MTSRPDGPLRVLSGPYTPRVGPDGRSRLPTPLRPAEDPCRVCPARCCHQKVIVSVPEALRIADTLDVPLASVVDFVPLDGPHSFPLDADAARASVWRAFEGTAGIALRRRDDGACWFLVDLDGFKRCSAYALRPGSCRLYPVSFEWGDLRSGPTQLLCPVPFAVTDAVVAGVEAAAAQTIDDWATHDAIVEGWAKAAVDRRSPELFWSYALDQLGRPDGDARRRRVGPSDAATALAELQLQSRNLR
jgi:Fe-S-cluster containining protein